MKQILVYRIIIHHHHPHVHEQENDSHLADLSDQEPVILFPFKTTVTQKTIFYKLKKLKQRILRIENENLVN